MKRTIPHLDWYQGMEEYVCRWCFSTRSNGGNATIETTRVDIYKKRLPTFRSRIRDNIARVV